MITSLTIPFGHTALSCSSWPVPILPQFCRLPGFYILKFSSVFIPYFIYSFLSIMSVHSLDFMPPVDENVFCPHYFILLCMSVMSFYLFTFLLSNSSFACLHSVPFLGIVCCFFFIIFLEILIR